MLKQRVMGLSYINPSFSPKTEGSESEILINKEHLKGIQK